MPTYDVFQCFELATGMSFKASFILGSPAWTPPVEQALDILLQECLLVQPMVMCFAEKNKVHKRVMEAQFLISKMEEHLQESGYYSRCALSLAMVISLWWNAE